MVVAHGAAYFLIKLANNILNISAEKSIKWFIEILGGNIGKTHMGSLWSI